MSELSLAAERAIERLGVGPADDVLVLCNDDQRAIAEAITQVAVGVARSARIVRYEALSRDGEEPPPAVSDEMAAATVILAATAFSLSHTRARAEATERGRRIASMPGITPEAFARAVSVDYDQLAKEGARIAAALTAASACRVTSPAGTDIELDLDGRSAISDDGDLRTVGAFGNLPAGEAFVAPVEGVGDGVIVFDGSLAAYGLLREPLRLELAGGRIVAAEGEAAEWLLDKLDAAGPSGRSLAELGIGTNPDAIVSGSILEDEKVVGTAHLAFGTNVSFGGANASTVHIDGLVLRPTVELDGRPLLRDGALVDPLSSP